MIVVSNELIWEMIFFGCFEVLEDGICKQSYQYDFFNYVGLVRLVWIYLVFIIYIMDIFIDINLFGNGLGIVDFEIQFSQIINDYECVVFFVDEVG